MKAGRAAARLAESQQSPFILARQVVGTMLRAMRLPALLLLLPVLACSVATVGCRTHAEPPPPTPAPVKPATGWTPALSTESADTLTEALTNDGWVNRFRETNGRMPVIAVSPFVDRSDDHVPVDDLAAEFVRRLSTSDRVLAASAGQVADVTLTGVVGLRDGSFTIDARIVDQRGDVQWVAGLALKR